MTTSIIKIGNSRGIIIPSYILKKLSLSHKDNVNISIEDGRIVIESKETKSFNGPFTGPFAELAVTTPVWDGDKDAAEVANKLRKSRKNKRAKTW